MKRFKNIKEFDAYLAQLEGKKHQATVGDVREIRKLICKLLRDPEILELLLANGRKYAGSN